MRWFKQCSSRRVPPLGDSDIDHEITLVDHSVSSTPNTSTRSREARNPPMPETSVEAAASSSSSNVNRFRGQTNATQPARNGGAPEGNGNATGIRPTSSSRAGGGDCPVIAEARQDQSPPKQTGSTMIRLQRSRDAKEPESAIDILYENQRGCILFRKFLFSSKALGSLDPTPWTNFAHKPSPTHPGTAQVPDPSWEWAWPEWHVNHDEGVDDQGWEYSFMFNNKFSWHGSKCWNSFVRRRAWIRKRIKKPAHVPDEGESPRWFISARSSRVGRSRSVGGHTRATSLSSRRGRSDHSRSGYNVNRMRWSMSQVGDADEGNDKPPIEDMDTLLYALRTLRIDREKLEALDSFLEHGETEYARLSDAMHEIMSLFIFRASRKILLSRLIEASDAADRLLENQKQQQQGEKEKADDGSRDAECLQMKAKYLSAAVSHANEEVRSLEYWSDFKGMAKVGADVGKDGLVENV